MISRELSLFIGTFTTLLAIINPIEVLPVYLKLLQGKDAATHREVAWKSCLYALLLSLFFLIFGTLILRVFGVPLAMVRIVGGIILVKIGFELFSPPASGGMVAADCKGCKYRLCAARDAADVRSGRNRDNPRDDLDDQAIPHRARFICRSGRRHRCHDARDVCVPELREQAFEDTGPDGDRCNHPYCRLLRFGNRSCADF